MRVLRRAFEEVLRMFDDVLIERCAGGHQNGDGSCGPAARSSGALQGRSDRSGVAGHDDRVQRSDIDSEFQRVRRNNGADVAIAQFAFDLAPLPGQVSAAISADGLGAHREPLARFLQIRKKDLGRESVIGEYQRLLTPYR